LPHEAIPHRIHPVNELPLTHEGKVQRAVLRQWAAAI
jgi:acyl-coenzyme A synthetase/AMP-(fatty) acid ligase